MGMNVGASSGSGDPEVMVDMNTTPLIDVMLVLLVMLIITIPIQYHAVNMNMPTGTPPPKIKEPEVVKLDVTAQNEVLWNGQSIPLGAALENRMRAAAAQADQPEIHLRPNKSAKYATVAAVLAASQREGLVKIGIVGSEQFADR
jgi:biopolymer transport protein ExbD